MEQTCCSKESAITWVNSDTIFHNSPEKHLAGTCSFSACLAETILTIQVCLSLFLIFPLKHILQKLVRPTSQRQISPSCVSMGKYQKIINELSHHSLTTATTIQIFRIRTSTSFYGVSKYNNYSILE